MTAFAKREWFHSANQIVPRETSNDAVRCQTGAALEGLHGGACVGAENPVYCDRGNIVVKPPDGRQKELLQADRGSAHALAQILRQCAGDVFFTGIPTNL